MKTTPKQTAPRPFSPAAICHSSFVIRHWKLPLLPALLALLSVLNPHLSTALAQGTAFNYSGHLSQADQPANGLVDLRFRLFLSPTTNEVVAAVTNPLVSVAKGVFLTSVDFGSNIFTGREYWLELGVRPGGASEDFTILDPRQPLKAVPYALHAPKAGEADTAKRVGKDAVHTDGLQDKGVTGDKLADGAVGKEKVAPGAVGKDHLENGAVTGDKLADRSVGKGKLEPKAVGKDQLEDKAVGKAQLEDKAVGGNQLEDNLDFTGKTVTGGTYAGGGAGLTGLNASQLTTGTVPATALSNAWLTTGNAGTTAGANFLGTTDNQPLEMRVNNRRVLRLDPTINHEAVNLVVGQLNTVGSNALASTLSGGWINSIQDYASEATIGGGSFNTIRSNTTAATISGGKNHAIEPSAHHAVISGGFRNLVQSNAVDATIGGGAANTIQAGADNATVSGGSGNVIQQGADNATVGGGYSNTNAANAATVGGGRDNAIETNAIYATVAGGSANLIQADARWSTLGGGVYNTVQSNAQFSTLSGGNANLIEGASFWSSIGGGRSNRVGRSAAYATIPGGRDNSATNYAFAAGRRAKANHSGAFVWADSTDADFASSANNQFAVRAGGGVWLETGGAGLKVDGSSVVAGPVQASQIAPGAVTSAKIADGAVLAEIADDDGAGSGLDADLLDGLDSTAFWKITGNGGTTAGTHFLGTTDNQPLEFKANNQRGWRLEPGASDSVNVIGGWEGNSVSPGVVGATIAGGGAGDYGGVAWSHRVGADFGTISGGAENKIQTNAYYATIGGGRENLIQTNAYGTTIGGGIGNTNQPNAFYSTIGGGLYNKIEADSYVATIGGGLYNKIERGGHFVTIGGGEQNAIQFNVRGATISGGLGNTIQTNASGATIGGGFWNAIYGSYATIGGGYANTIHEDPYATIGGGRENTIQTNAWYATIGGGHFNTIGSNALYATIPGGRENSATNYAFAAGRRAKANHTGAFIWADSTDADFASSANNEFAVRAGGGVRLETGGAGLRVDGNSVVAGLVQASQIAPGAVTSAKIADGAVLAEIADDDGAGSGLDADLLDGLNSAAFWKITGNGGTTAATHFLGTTDSQPLEFRVNNQLAFRLESAMDSFGYPRPNVIGGFFNTISNVGSVVGGGSYNDIGTNSNYSIIAGGYANTIGTNSESSGIGGGFNNTVGADSACSYIAGGDGNHIGANSSYGFIAAGTDNVIDAESGFNAIGGGLDNFIGRFANGSTIAGGERNDIAARSMRSSISGGFVNSIGFDSSYSTIGGGEQQTIAANSHGSTIAGGAYNSVGDDSPACTIAGGYDNDIGTNSRSSSIGGGYDNTIPANALYATIPGGRENSATNYAFAAGRRAKANHTGAFVWADSTDADFASTGANQFLIRASGGVGINTPAPTAELHVSGPSPASSTDPGQVHVAGDEPTGAADTGAGLCFSGHDGSIPRIWGYLRCLKENGTVGSLNSYLSLATRSAGGISERLRIDSSGNVGVGRTPSANRLEVEGQASKTVAGSWVANSDARIKQDIQPVAGALDKLTQVRLVQFHYTDAYRARHPSVEDRSYLNVVAQEFQKVFPEYVKSSGEKLADGSEILQVDTYPLTIYTAAAVQELHQQLKAKEARIADLEKRLERIERLLSQRNESRQ